MYVGVYIQESRLILKKGGLFAMMVNAIGYGTSSPFMGFGSTSSVTNGVDFGFGTNAVEEANGVDKVGRDGKGPEGECQTCKNRKYQDGSDEMVSFKSASHIAPEAAASRVRGHEGEHVSNAYKKAFQEGGKVVSVGVSLHTAVCPECGRTYVSGGTTNTVISTPRENTDKANPYMQNKAAISKANSPGLVMNVKA